MCIRDRDQAVGEVLSYYLEEHPKEAKTIVDKVILAAPGGHGLTLLEMPLDGFPVIVQVRLENLVHVGRDRHVATTDDTGDLADTLLDKFLLDN